MQKLQNRFPLDLVEGWNLDLERIRYILVQIQTKVADLSFQAHVQSFHQVSWNSVLKFFLRNPVWRRGTSVARKNLSVSVVLSNHCLLF